MTLNDAILAATGGPTVNDGLRAYYLANGAVSGALPDLERQFLLANGGVSSSNQDMWMQVLGAAGYTGTLNDMLYQFWLAGGVIGGFDPSELFALGQQGVYYDPSDLSTLFQDSAGTTPVTAAGQEVGLMLDKSQGLELGPELVTNGDFTTTVNGWAAVAGSTIEWDNGALKTVTTNINQGATQTISTVAGRSYKISGTAVSGSSFRIFFGGAARAVAVGPWSFVLTATGATTELRLSNSEAVRTLVYDNISVKLLAGNHASQPTATMRPILQESGGLYSLKFDGIDDGLSTGNIDFGATVLTSFVGQMTTTASASVTVWNGSQGSGYWGIEDEANPSYPHQPIIDPVTYLNNGVELISPTRGDLYTLRNNTKVASTTMIGDYSVYASGYGIYIGGYTGIEFGGNLYSLVIAGALYDQETINSMNEWVAQKTGVTLP